MGIALLALLVAADPSRGQDRTAKGAASMDGDVSESNAPMMSETIREAGKGPRVLRAPGLSKGVDSIIAAIRKRELELARREQEIAERERAVVELEGMIETRATQVDRARVAVEERIADWASQGPDRIAQLSSVYASMPAAKAGSLLSQLELDLAVSVVRGMKKKSSAGVLAAMRPDRALLITRRLLKPLDPRTDAPAKRRP